MPDATEDSKGQALLWPQLLYALAMVAGKGDPPNGRIWVRADGSDELRLTALDGVSLMTARHFTAHSLEPGVWTVDPANHSKKPGLSKTNTPSLYRLEWWGESLPFDTAKVRDMMAGEPTEASVAPERAARFFKAAAAICGRVEFVTLEKAITYRCLNTGFDGEVRGVLANLAVKGG